MIERRLPLRNLFYKALMPSQRPASKKAPTICQLNDCDISKDDSPIPEVNESDINNYRRILKIFNADWYLYANIDVAQANLDPFAHFLEYGLAEGRSPCISCRLHRIIASSSEGSLLYCNDKNYEVITRCYAEEVQDFLIFLKKYFNCEWYLNAHPDVAAANLNPLEHYLDYGIYEQRKFSPDVYLRRPLGDSLDILHEYIFWGGQPYCIIHEKIPDILVQKIRTQAWHDLSVLAPGAKSIQHLRFIRADDLLDRDGISVSKFISSFHIRPEVVFILPHLMVGGAEKFTAQLSRALRKLGRHAIATIITDHSESDHRTERNYDILQPLFEGDIVFWPDCAPKAVQSPHVLARALNALHPREVIVINSRLGMDAIRISGNGLSQFMDLYCGYFSTGVDGLGAPYGTRYPRHTSPYAFTFTDNHRMMDELVRRFTGGSGKRVGKIPPVVHPTSDAQFERQLSRLSDRRGAKPRRWLWISRVEAWKGTHVLGRVAAQRPEEQFDIYGPLSEPLKTLGLKGQNITCHGPTPGISSMDLSAYDGFLFTSLFEGMPNVVLEIAAQHALPMVLSDVGGLRQCFMDSAIFVGVAGEIEAVAGRFSLALEKLASLHVDEVHTLVRAARRAVLNQHSEEAHLQAVASIFGAR